LGEKGTRNPSGFKWISSDRGSAGGVIVREATKGQVVVCMAGWGLVITFLEGDIYIRSSSSSSSYGGRNRFPIALPPSTITTCCTCLFLGQMPSGIITTLIGFNF